MTMFYDHITRNRRMSQINALSIYHTRSSDKKSRTLSINLYRKEKGSIQWIIKRYSVHNSIYILLIEFRPSWAMSNTTTLSLYFLWLTSPLYRSLFYSTSCNSLDLIIVNLDGTKCFLLCRIWIKIKSPFSK